MNMPKVPNLIRLIDGVILNEVGFWDEEWGKHPFDTHDESVDNLLCQELKRSHIHEFFVEYIWQNIDELPYPTSNMAPPLDFSQFNVIVPITREYLPIASEGRKIILTFPSLYDKDNPGITSRHPHYAVSVRSEEQLDLIRCLKPELGRPFYGLEEACTDKGFAKLPKLCDTKGYGIIRVEQAVPILPASNNEVL